MPATPEDGSPAPPAAGSVPLAAFVQFTTPQVVAAVQVSRQTLMIWVRKGLLPEPERMNLGRRGTSSGWPSFTIELALFVKSALDRRLSLQSVARTVRPLLERDREWIVRELASGKTLESLITEAAAKAK